MPSLSQITYPGRETALATHRILQGARGGLTPLQFYQEELRKFLESPTRHAMVEGLNYYRGDQDIRRRRRMVIGRDGLLEEVTNLPNNKIVDNQYRKMVDQKTNYLVGQPLALQCDNETYSKLLQAQLHRKFQRVLKNVCQDSLNCGLGWLHIYYDPLGELCLQRFRPYEILPGWSDSDHTHLDYALRHYQVWMYDGPQEQLVDKVELYTQEGISYYTLETGGILTPAEPFHRPYFTLGDQGYNWEQIPLIPFKSNTEEQTLLSRVKSLQDGINLIASNFQNNMEEDPRNTILVVIGHGGEDMGEFRRNLAVYGAVSVANDAEGGGDVKSLQVQVNSENYQAILELFKKALIENAMGFDGKDDRLNGDPNQMNIQSMYSDIDLDANNMETEFQASMEGLLAFFSAHFYNTGQGDFSSEAVEIIFNRDMLLNETEAIDNCLKASALLSEETTLANFPWVDDFLKEKERKRQEQAESLASSDPYQSTFAQQD